MIYNANGITMVYMVPPKMPLVIINLMDNIHTHVSDTIDFFNSHIL